MEEEQTQSEEKTGDVPGQNTQTEEQQRPRGSSVVDSATNNTPGSNTSSSGSQDTGMLSDDVGNIILQVSEGLNCCKIYEV